MNVAPTILTPRGAIPRHSDATPPSRTNADTVPEYPNPPNLAPPSPPVAARDTTGGDIVPGDPVLVPGTGPRFDCMTVLTTSRGCVTKAAATPHIVAHSPCSPKSPNVCRTRG